ncbi:MAG: hypothetical protein ACLVAP_11395 [Parasutterella sp.]
MLRKEDFPKEPIEILKDILISEEFKEIASLIRNGSAASQKRTD